MSAGPRRKRAAAALAAVVVLSGLVAVAAWGAKDDLTLVSRVSGANGAGANESSGVPSVSTDGRYVAFYSLAANLSGEDVDPLYDIFVRDLETQVVTLASRATGAGGAVGTDVSLNPVMSANGRHVAFQSNAPNFTTEDNDGYTDIFVRNLQANTTTLVSRATGAAGTGADDQSYNASISADGRYVAFQSRANNLSTEDNDTFSNVFVRDLQANTTTLVSRATGAAGAGADDNAYSASISADGRYVAFYSQANNLSTEDNDTYANVFVRDLQANTTTLVSRTAGAAGPGGDGDSYQPQISANGQHVAFWSTADNLSGDDDNVYSNVFVRDLGANAITLVSRAGDAAANDDSRLPSISANGRRVSFYSYADNLSTEDNNAYYNVFVRDLQANTLTLASRASGSAGTAGDGHSTTPAMSPDGRYVVFSSDANDLSDDDNDAFTNIFLRDLGPIPGGDGGGGGGGDGTDSIKPRLSRLGMSNRKFRVGRARTPISAAVKVGTRFRYSLTELSTVRITIERALPGRRARKRSGPCRAPSRSRAKNRKCTRYKRAGTLIRKSMGPGRESTSFSGRIGRKALKAGRYRATLRATDAAGNRSGAKRLSFTVVAP